jgi:hypothetical protein
VIRFQNRIIFRPKTGEPVPQQQGLSGATFIAMMQAGDLREGDDLASGWRLSWARFGTILVEREMRPRPMIILNIGRQGAAQVTLIENDNVIETLVPNRANDPLDISILPG